MNEEITLRLETFNDKEYILADDCIKAIGIHRKTNTKLHKEIKRLKEEYMILQNASDEVEEEKDREIERLKEQLNDETDDELKQIEIMVKQQNEIERLTLESTKWESKFYDEAKKVDKAIEYIEEQSKFIKGCDIYQICNKDVLLNILKGSDKK